MYLGDAWGTWPRVAEFSLIRLIKRTVKLLLKRVLSLSRKYVDDVRISYGYIWWTDKLIYFSIIDCDASGAIKREV